MYFNPCTTFSLFGALPHRTLENQKINNLIQIEKLRHLRLQK